MFFHSKQTRSRYRLSSFVYLLLIKYIWVPPFISFRAKESFQLTFLFCQKSLAFFLHYYGSKKISHCLFSFFKESFQEVPESVDVLEETITSDDHHVEVEDDNNLKPSLLLSNASSIAETDGDSVVVISPPQTPCSLDTPSPSCLSPVPNEGEIHNMQHFMYLKT